MLKSAFFRISIMNLLFIYESPIILETYRSKLLCSSLKSGRLLTRASKGSKVSTFDFKNPPKTVLFQRVKISKCSSKDLRLGILPPNLILVNSFSSLVFLSKTNALFGLYV